MYDEISRGAEFGVVFREPISVSPLTKDLVASDYTGIASTFAHGSTSPTNENMLEQVSLLIAKIEGLQIDLDNVDAAA
jgi:hypothetical protein